MVFDDTATGSTSVNISDATVSPNSTTFNNSTKSYTISGGGIATGSLTKSGANTVSLTNSNTYSGATTINGGSLLVSGGSAIANTGLVTLGNVAGATFQVVGSETIGALSGGGAAGGAVSIDASQTLTLSSGTQTYAGTVSGSGTLTSSGATQTLNGALSHGGGVNVTSAVLTLGSASNSYTGSTVISSGAGLLVTANNALGAIGTGNGTTVTGTGSALISGALGFSGGINYSSAEKIIGSGVGNTSALGVFASVQRGFIQSVSGNNTFAGDIELSTNGVSRIGTQDGASLTLTGAITQGAGVTTANILFRVGSNDGDYVTLSNAGNSFGADSQIFTGLNTGSGYAGVRLGVTNGLPTNLTVSGGSATGSGTALDLAGYDQSLNGLIAGTGTNSLKIINTNTGTPVTLTLNPTVNKSSSNTTILGGGGLGVINVVKDGTFSQTLGGINSYTGNTTVNAGTLSLGSVNANNETATVTIASTGAFLALTHASTDTVGTLFIGATQLAAGQYGNSSSVLPVIGISQITGTGTLTVTSGPPASGYASWIASFFPGETNLAIIGVDVDPDNDGIDNGVEMVIGGNPATGMDTALLPTIALVTDPVSTPAIPAGSYLLFTYRRSDLSVAGGVASACQTDTDLAGPWTTAIDGASGVVIQVDDNFTFTPPAAGATDRVRVYVPRGAITTLFGRLDAVTP